MKPKVAVLLADMLESALSIKEYTSGIKMYNDFIARKIVLRAVEKELEIIAEALIKIEKENYTLNISAKRQIIGLRNRIVHDYSNTNYEIIWGVVYNHLDVLILEIKSEISKFE
jgi:uncharacterized protein with HEPN domain